MVIDTSALLAILFGEPEAEAFSQEITKDPKRLVSALSALEAAVVLHARKGPSGLRELDLLLHSATVTIVSFDADQVLLARSAYEKYGAGCLWGDRDRAEKQRPLATWCASGP
jgi:ribonuclease VapC